MESKAYFKCFRLFYETGKKITDPELKAKYYESLLEYGLDWIKPQDPIIDALLTSAMYSIDKSDENTEKKSNYMKGNKNAVKNFEKLSKQRKTENNRNKQKQTEKNARRIEDNNIISKDIINNSKELLNTNSNIENNITEEINNLIKELKETANFIWIAYDKKDERNFARHILTAKDYGELAEKAQQTRVEFAKNVMIASLKVNYWKWVCSWPKAIYQNYTEVFNKAAELHKKTQEWIF